MRMGCRHWMTAVIMAIALHAGVAVAMFWQRADPGARAPGIGGIEIALGPAGGAPGDVSAEEHSTEADEAARAEPAPEPPPPETAQPIPEPPSEPAEPELPEVIEPITGVTEAEPPTDAVEETPLAETTQLVEPPTDAIEETPLAETAEIVEPPTDVVEETPLVETTEIVEQATSLEEIRVTEPRSVTVPPRPKPKPSPPEPPRAIAKPEPAAEPLVENVPDTATSDRPSEAQLSVTEPATPGSGGKAGAQEAAPAGSSAADAAAGGRPAAKADYGAILLAWLERHKDYPRVAQKRRQQGVVLLYIVLDRGGRVIEAHIQESSGYRLLDDAALAMLKRAQPLPPIPDDIQEERFRFVVPVQFFMT